MRSSGRSYGYASLRALASWRVRMSSPSASRCAHISLNASVGPVHSRSEDRSHLLASCHTEVLKAADELGAKTVAFPAISTGVYGYPLELAAPVAINAVKTADTKVEEVRFVLFDEAAYRAFERALAGA